MRGTLLALAAAALVIAAPAPARAQVTIHVATTGTDTATCGTTSAPCRTITAALALTEPGDTVTVASGSYNECVDVVSGTGTGGVQLTTESYQASSTVRDAVLDGAGVCDTAAGSAGAAGPVVTLEDGSSLSGFQIQHGGDSGVQGYGAVTIVDNEIIANSTDNLGGGIYIETGIFLSQEMPTTVSSNTVTANTAGQNGGGIYVYATGAGINSAVTLDGNTVTNNTAGGADGAFGAYGGGIAVFTDSITPGDESTVTVTNNTVTGNTALNAPDGSSLAYGGGIFVATGATSGLGTETITVGGDGVRNIVRSNASEGFGGGISANLQAGSGGTHTLDVDGNSVTYNTAEGGAGIHAFATAFDLSAMTAGTLQVQNNFIKGNQVDATATNPTVYGGGGIYGEVYSFRSPAASNALEVFGNDVEANETTATGGGVSLVCYATDDPNMDGATAAASAAIAFHNNLVAGNTVATGGRGGGVYVYAEAQGDLASVDVNHDFLTVAGNQSDMTTAGGLEWDATVTPNSLSTTGQVLFTLSNSIITGNTGFGTGGQILPGGGINVDILYDDAFGNAGGDWESQLGVIPGENGILSVDPALDAVYETTPCSAMIDAGDPASAAIADEPEPNGGRVNLGFRGGTAGATATYPDINGDRTVDGLDILALAVAFNTQSGDPRYSAAADINRNTHVDGDDLAYLAAYYALSCP